MKLYENLQEKLGILKEAPSHKEYIKSIKAFYEEQKGKPVENIDYDVYMEFFRSGSRVEYEKRYFNKRKRLGAAAMLYLLYKKEEYLKEVCNMIWLICSEVQWALPAHLAGRKMERHRNEIDLMAAETAGDLAEIDYLLGESLPQNVRDLVRKEIADRIFSRFENESVYWETKYNNWAAVCGGGVGRAYMLIAPKRFETVKPRLLSAMNVFLDSYGDDGCCLEGVGYWGYGFGAYLMFSDMLYHFSAGEDDIRHSEKIDKIATYIQNVTLRDNIAISFSDGSRSLAFNNVHIISYLYSNYEGYLVPQYSFGNFADSRFASVIRKFIWWNPEIETRVSPVDNYWNFFTSAQWYINKKERFSFSAKGGHNDEPHNHNDIGSFIFVTDKGQILADIGCMEYTRDNFNENRYKFLQNASWGHNVPIIGEHYQLNGKEYCGEIVNVDENEFSLRIEKAYGDDCPQILRRFKILENGVELKDTFGATQEKITERFISVTEPQITENGVEIADCVITAGDVPKISSKVLINHQLKPETIYVMDYVVTGDEFKLEIKVK